MGPIKTRMLALLDAVEKKPKKAKKPATAPVPKGSGGMGDDAHAAQSTMMGTRGKFWQS